MRDKRTIGFYKVRGSHDSLMPLTWTKKDGRIYYVNGQGEYNVSSAVLDYLDENEADYEIISALEFDSATPPAPFVDAIKYWYDRKQEPGSMAKQVINGIYGICCMDAEDRMIATNKEIKGAVRVQGVTFYKCPYSFRKLMHYATWIADSARVYHQRLMDKVNASTLYYYDTDSIFTTSKYPTGTGIGQLKLVGEYDHFEAYSTKHYSLFRGQSVRHVCAGTERLDNYTLRKLSNHRYIPYQYNEVTNEG